MTNSPLRQKSAGFSLIELLVVCAIIAIVIGFTVPAATTLIRGSQLTQASQVVADQIALARQTALSKNHAVEVRFYKFGDPETPGEDATKPATGKFRGMQLFEVLENGTTVPTGKIQILPTSVIMNEGALSTLISDTSKQPFKDASQDPSAPELPRNVGRNYLYVSFRFLQDGSTDLPLTSTTGSSTSGGGSSATNLLWFVTLHSSQLSQTLAEPVGPDKKGINFFTLQVDPVSGSTKQYRPTAG